MMTRRRGGVLVFAAWLAAAAWQVAAGPPADDRAAENHAAARPRIAALALPGAGPDGVFLDYLAADRPRHQVWVPAGGTGRVDMIDTRTREIRQVGDFPVARVERGGRTRTLGPSSVTVGDGFVYVGDRADSSVCAIDARTLSRRGCVTLPSMPDGVAFVRPTKEVWVTTPRDRSIVILDVSAPAAPRLAGSFTLEGDPEGFAVDEERGLFYTNLEDKDRTLRVSTSTHRVTGDWKPGCGGDGPRGLALAAGGRVLLVACTDHLAALAALEEGRVVSTLETGGGLDNLDFLPEKRLVYAAAAGAGTLTTARIDETGNLHRVATTPTARGARNAVAGDDGAAYVADGAEGKILIVEPPAGE
jgi:DNA-binding beta-propeller fold protein YncE